MALEREEGVTLEMIFSAQWNGREVIGEGMHTFNSKTRREKEGDKDNFKIATKHNRDDKSKKGMRKPSIYTQNWALMCI